MGNDGEYRLDGWNFDQLSPDASREIREGYGNTSTVDSSGEFIPGGCPERRLHIRGISSILQGYNGDELRMADHPADEAGQDDQV